MNTSPKISVIFSFRNEEPVLEALIQRIRAVFKTPPFDYELIFVNDASTDRSFEILMAKRREDARIKILNMSRRFGVPACAMAGFDHASGDAVIIMDADLQDPPEVIPGLIQKWQEGADIVHTVRTAREGESWFKLVFTALGYRIWKVLAHADLPLDAGDFKLLSKRAVKELVKFRERELFFRGITASLGFKQAFVPYKREKRPAGKTHFPLLGSLGPVKMFLSGIIPFSSFPVILFGWMTLISALTVIFFWVKPSAVNPLFILSFLSLAQLVTLFGIAVYVYKIYLESLRRPLYIIEEKYGFPD